MKPIVRVGILGTGFIAGEHCHAYKRVYGVDAEVIGAFDVVASKCKEFAKVQKIKHFDSPEELFRACDAVDICTPPFAHKEAIIAAANYGKHIICEKPLIGFSPVNSDGFNGLEAPKAPMLKYIQDSVAEIKAAVAKNGVSFIYFENFIYTPQIQKEAEILRKGGGQILRMIGEEAHKGNHAAYSSHWKHSCGGSLISTGSHPLGAILYLKRVEGMARTGKPIRPRTVSARVHTLTRNPDYCDAGFLRNDYYDVEDYAWAHITFDDGMVGDVIAGATVLGGINDYVDVFANNHRSKLTINPVDLVNVYNPGDESFENIYMNYGTSHNKGWMFASPDENIMFGYQAEIQDAMECIAYNRQPESGLELASDTVNVIYAGYLSSEKGGQEIKLDEV